MQGDLLADQPVAKQASEMDVCSACEEAPLPLTRAHMLGRQRWKEKAPAALCCQSGTLRLTRGPWVMCAMRCDCDLGKKNVTAGLYFQQIFLNIN